MKGEAEAFEPCIDKWMSGLMDKEGELERERERERETERKI